jgi:N6-L-threonylcarbamoyladenine synthase
VIEKALSEAKTDWENIDAVAVTYGPGLMGSLLIGTLIARTLAHLKHKPLYAINHVEAHLYANFIGQHQPQFPLLALIVSGGHTQLVLMRSHGDYDLLGQTRDDAAGEAFDKVAKMIGLPYPGGPSIAQAATTGDPAAFAFPKPHFEKGSLEFSFSGLKTAVLRQAQTLAGADFRLPSHELPSRLSDQQRADIAASFQQTVVDILVARTIQAYQRYQPRSVVIAGGVAANQALRDELRAQLPIDIKYAPMALCTDNAAMVASLGYFQAQHGQPADPHHLSPAPVLSM